MVLKYATGLTSSPPVRLRGLNQFSGRQDWSRGADIASAATIVLGSDGNMFKITGSVQIDTITGGQDGSIFALWFAAGTLLSAAGNILTKGGARTTVADEIVVFQVRDNTGIECIELETSVAAAGGGGDSLVFSMVAGGTVTAGIGVSVDPDTEKIIDGTKAIQQASSLVAPTLYPWRMTSITADKFLSIDGVGGAAISQHSGIALTLTSTNNYLSGTAHTAVRRATTVLISLSDTLCVVIYRGTTATPLYYRIGTIVGSVVTWGAETQIAATSETGDERKPRQGASRISDTRFAVAYVDTGTGNIAVAIIDVVFGALTPITMPSASPRGLAIATLSADRLLVVAAGSGGTSKQDRFEVTYGAGGAESVTAPTVINVVNQLPWIEISAGYDSNTVLITSAGSVGLYAWVYSADTSSGGPSLTVTGDSSNGGWNSRLDNDTAVVTSTKNFGNGNLVESLVKIDPVTLTASVISTETLFGSTATDEVISRASKDGVSILQTGFSPNETRIKVLSGFSKYVGIAQDSGILDDAINVLVKGPHISTGLVLSSQYYFDSAGALTLSASDNLAGIALSATVLHFDAPTNLNTAVALANAAQATADAALAGVGIISTSAVVKVGKGVSAGTGVSIDTSGEVQTGIEVLVSRTAPATNQVDPTYIRRPVYVEQDKLIVLDDNTTSATNISGTLFHYPGGVLTAVDLGAFLDGVASSHAYAQTAEFTMSEDRTRIAVAYREGASVLLRVGGFNNTTNIITWAAEVVIHTNTAFSISSRVSIDLIPGTNLGVVAWGDNVTTTDSVVNAKVFDFSNAAVGALMSVVLEASGNNLPPTAIAVTSVSTSQMIVYASGFDGQVHLAILLTRSGTTLTSGSTVAPPFNGDFSSVTIPTITAFNGNAAIISYNTTTNIGGYHYVVIDIAAGPTLATSVEKLYFTQAVSSGDQFIITHQLGNRSSNIVTVPVISRADNTGSVDYPYMTSAEFTGTDLVITAQISFEAVLSDVVLRGVMAMEVAPDKWVTYWQDGTSGLFSDINKTGETAYIGLAVTSAGAGATVEIVTDGDFAVVGKTPGSPQYLDRAGNLTEMPSSSTVSVGTSITASKIAVDMGLAQASSTSDIAALSLGVTNLAEHLVSKVAGEPLIAGDVCHLMPDGMYYKTIATAAATSTSQAAVARETILTGNTGVFFINGATTTIPGLTVGTVYYLDPTVDGNITPTVPAVSGDVIRVIGYGDENGNLLFTPSPTWTVVP